MRTRLKKDKSFVVIANRFVKIKSIAFTCLLSTMVALSSCHSKHNMEAMNMSNDSSIGTGDYLKGLDLANDKRKITSSVPVIHAEQKFIQQTISADGIISYDTRQEKNIAARYSGRIEKLYIKYVYQPVTNGELLMEVYSPEMVTEQQNLILLLNDPSPDQQLISASKRKLLLLGMTQEEIDKVVASKQPLDRLKVYSPYEGHIHQATTMSDQFAMNEYNMSELSLKEGMYIEKGQTMFNILNPHQVWAELKIYSDDAAKIKMHQQVELTVDGLGKKIPAQIDFIDPVYSPDSKTLSARVYLDNMDHSLKVGMYVHSTITVDSAKGLWIPRTAMLDLGTQKIVWIKRDKFFQAQEIKTGIASGDFVQVENGIDETNEIASNAQYIADSESFITTK